MPTLDIVRERDHAMKHTVHVRTHALPVDEPPSNGGEDLGVTPHELYDAALGACKAMTVLWYAKRKQIPLEDIRVAVERDDADERRGVYRLRATLQLGGPLSDEQRAQLLAVAAKCPVHKLMTEAKTEVVTELAAPVRGKESA